MNLQIALGNMDILMMLMLPVHEQVCTSTYLYLLSSVSYNFLSTGLSHPWLGLFLGVFILFEAIVNGIIFLISLSGSSLLAYKNVTDS